MIVARTPVRVSFLGGGTDYPDYFLHHGGRTLGVAIDRYSYVSVSRLAPLFDHSIRVSYSRTELVRRVEEIEHPSVRECLRFMEIDGGIEIHYVGDLPARTGLGSSSSFTVALLHALHTFKGEHVGQEQLAAEAVTVEQEWIHERVGVQDQYTCALGGLVHLRMEPGGRIDSQRLALSDERLAALRGHLLLLYTGLQRHAHEVLEEQLDRTRRGDVTASLRRLAELACQGVDLLDGTGSLLPFGELLHDGWEIKRGLSSKITNDSIDDAYTRARSAGAIGGKLLGAGGGGFLLLFVPTDRRGEVLGSVPGLRSVDVGFDRAGSRIIFDEPQ